MVDRIIHTIEKFELLQNGDRVIIALSGGADSVALLHTLCSIKEKYNLTLFAAHLNHGLRGGEADRDEKFCKSLCKKHKVEFFVKRMNIRAIAEEQKISDELCGRNERYNFLEELAKELHAKIATAHTASDNAETLIFNLARGCGLSGAAAIPPRRGNIVRPLIELTRSEIEAYCAEHKLDYVTDSTNLEDCYSRNRLRHRVIPEIMRINPVFEVSALRFTQDVAEVRDYIKAQARKAADEARVEGGYSASKLLSNDPAIVKNAVIAVCKEKGVVPERRHVALMIKALNNGGAVELSKRYTAVCSQGIFRLAKSEGPEELLFAPFTKRVMNFEYNGKRIRAEINNSNLENYKLIFRTRAGGDTFTFKDRGITKPLRKAMNEAKISAELRDTAVVLAGGTTIFYCEGLGYSALGDMLVKNESLKITITEINGEGDAENA